MGPIRLVVVAVAIVALLGGLSGCDWALLDPKGPVGRAERTLMIDSLVIMLAIVVPTIVATLWFAWWYRASNPKARYLPTWDFSGRLELVVWAIPTMTIILLGGVAWISSHQLDPAEPLDRRIEPLDVQVVSLDWKWLFLYPDQDVASVNELVIPAGVPVRFSITSASVFNTFFVPRLGSMIYAMNGMRTVLHLQADEPGSFDGMSAHFSGDGFSDMSFVVRAVRGSEFDAWVRGARGGGQALDAAAYRRLAQQSSPVKPATWSGLERDLFARIVSQKIAPGPGPAIGRQGASEAPAPTATSRKP